MFCAIDVTFLDKCWSLVSSRKEQRRSQKEEHNTYTLTCGLTWEFEDCTCGNVWPTWDNFIMVLDARSVIAIKVIPRKVIFEIVYAYTMPLYYLLGCQGILSTNKNKKVPVKSELKKSLLWAFCIYFSKVFMFFFYYF